MTHRNGVGALTGKQKQANFSRAEKMGFADLGFHKTRVAQQPNDLVERISVQILDHELLIAECLAFCLNKGNRFRAVAAEMPARSLLSCDDVRTAASALQRCDVYVLRGKLESGSTLNYWASEILRIYRHAKLIFLSPSLTSPELDFALEFGAHGVADETMNVARLGNIIEFIFNGEFYFPKDYIIKRARDSMGVFSR